MCLNIVKIGDQIKISYKDSRDYPQYLQTNSLDCIEENLRLSGREDLIPIVRRIVTMQK